VCNVGCNGGSCALSCEDSARCAQSCDGGNCR
jgi:hypothetical protein